MKKLTITVPEDLARWLRAKAAKDDRTVSQWICELLERERHREDDYINPPGTTKMSTLVSTP